MNLELRVDGESFIKVDVNANVFSQLIKILKSPIVTSAATIAKSAPLTVAQVDELFSRIDAKSVHFLKRLAANGGSITWGEMKEIFGISEWNTYSSGYGKGITRALRHILDDKSARLVWWIDAEWDELEEWEQDPCKVYVDGAALHAIREVSGN